ncbi:unnamed protein product [Brassica rapa]|uniref:MATH domain-containing protein n=1 Tax=Brassica campestris TaxID=3711 RepID=A0A8D9G480_BRACM|nr:unnamed protein product [Brassica rapa]
MDGQKWSLGLISLAFLFIACSSAELLIQQVTRGRGTEINSSYSLEANLGVTRVLRDERPSSKIVTIAGYSVIKERHEPYESSVFEAAGYKWMEETESLPYGWEVNVDLKLFVHNPKQHKYLAVTAEQQEKVTFISNPPNNVFTWKILRFSSLEDKFYYSDDFLVGDRYWRLGFNPKGDGEGRPHALPIYLYAQGFRPNAVATNTWGAVNLRLKNQRSSNHRQLYSAAWYPIRSDYGVGKIYNIHKMIEFYLFIKCRFSFWANLVPCRRIMLKYEHLGHRIKSSKKSPRGSD